jgi:uncharacterized repeat protein (TIGR03803 family)
MAAGGKTRSGTVFLPTTSRLERAVSSFKSPPGDGSFPYSPVTEINGIIYGMTQSGGTYGGGTVFRLALSGSKTSAAQLWKWHRR